MQWATLFWRTRTNAFTRDYIIFVVVTVLGMIQIIAAWDHLLGLRFVQRGWPGYVIGVAAVVGAVVWFFGSGPRNIEGHITGLQGFEQFLWFIVGAGIAFGLTGLIVSAKHWRSRPVLPPAEHNLEALRTHTYLQLLLRMSVLRGKR